MSYQIKEQDPFIVKGKKGKEYKIPRIDGLSVDEFAVVMKYTETEDPVERVRICKDFILMIVPEIEEENIGDVEYYRIFEEYNKIKTEKQKKKLGE